MAVEILNFQGEVIYTHQGEALRGANLIGANLRDANLSGANLRDASLRDASLRGADLSGADLRCADLSGASLRGANLIRADLSGADLSGANLIRANLIGAHLIGVNLIGANLRDASLIGAGLSSADLRRADLRCADLRCANLRDANLIGANLIGAKGYDSRRTNPLHFLSHQVHPLIAYKLVTEDYTGPFYTGVEYRVGTEVSVEEWDSDPANDCGPGINLATLDWVLREWRNGYRVLQVECYPAEGICVPDASDGKFRVKRCKVLKEMDLAELGYCLA